MHKGPLWHYVVAVVIILAILNGISLSSGWARPKLLYFSIGFLLGMAAMYIAVHLYRWQ